MQFVWVFLPKLLLFIHIAAYLIGGTILFVVNDAVWQEAIGPWGGVEIGFCLVLSIWLGIGKALQKRAQKSGMQNALGHTDAEKQGKTRENKEEKR